MIRPLPLLLALGLLAPLAHAADKHTVTKPLRPSLEALPEHRLATTDAPEHYGVTEGSCNRLMIGAVLGGVIAPGERIGGGGERATPVARLTGSVLGSDTHAEVEDPERGCAQQVLEFGADDAPVAWHHGELRFRMTPRHAEGDPATRCRAFEFVAQGGLMSGKRRARACRGADQAWEIRD